MSTPLAIGRVFVSAPAVSGAPTTQIPASGNFLYADATGNLNLNPGFLGFYEPVVNSGIPTAVNGTTNLSGKDLTLYYIPNNAGLASVLPRRVIEKTQAIYPNSNCKIRITKQAPRLGVNEMHIMEASLGGGAPFSPQEEFSYNIITRAKGAMVDLLNGARNSSAGKNITYVTPDFANLGITAAAAKRDLILANLSAKFNRQSNPTANVHVAFNIGQTSPYAGAITVTAASALAIGSKFLIGYEKNGNPENIVITPGIKAALTAVAALNTVNDAGANAAIGTMFIVPYYIPGTQNVPVLVPVSGTGGAVVRAQHTLYLCLDFAKAYYNENVYLKTGMELGLAQGFIEYGATGRKLVSMTESINDSAKVRWAYREEEYRKYNASAGKVYEYMHIQYPNEIREGGLYDSFVIEWCSPGRTNIGGSAEHRHSVQVFVPNYSVGTIDTNTFFNFSGALNPQLTYVTNVLQDFSTDNNLGITV